MLEASTKIHNHLGEPTAYIPPKPRSHNSVQQLDAETQDLAAVIEADTKKLGIEVRVSRLLLNRKLHVVLDESLLHPSL